MEGIRKRSSQTPIDDLEAQVRGNSANKRQRTSSCPNEGVTPADDTLAQRFKQPENLLGPSICSLCERNITKSIKILCAECAPTSVNENAKAELVMCLECLRLGKRSEDYPDHEPTHAYYVYDNLDFPLLTPKWTAS